MASAILTLASSFFLSKVHPSHPISMQQGWTRVLQVHGVTEDDASSGQRSCLGRAISSSQGSALPAWTWFDTNSCLFPRHSRAGPGPGAAVVETRLYRQTAGIKGRMELRGRGFQQLHTLWLLSPRMRTPPAPDSDAPSPWGDVLPKPQGTSQRCCPPAHTFLLPVPWCSFPQPLRCSAAPLFILLQSWFHRLVMGTGLNGGLLSLEKAVRGVKRPGQVEELAQNRKRRRLSFSWDAKHQYSLSALHLPRASQVQASNLRCTPGR